MTEAKKADWKPFAWEGMQLTVPADWELGAVSGDGRKGTFRLDDERLARLEAHWEVGRPQTDLAPIAERHVAGLKKAAQKQGLDFRLDPDAKVALPEGMQAVCFGWKSDVRAFNLLAFCPACRRVSLLRVISRPRERLRPVAARVFASFADHACEGVVPWAAYGMRLEAPERFRLEKHTLNLQRIELEFEDGPDRVAAARFNLAEINLRGKNLRQWLADMYAKQLNDLRLETADEEYRGHPSVRLAGRPKRFRFQALRSRGMRFAGRIWRCEEEDKIFVVRWRSRESRLGEFAPFSDSVFCH